MSLDWRWCLKIGAIIVLVDALALLIGRGQGPDIELTDVLASLDHFANIALFGYVGFRTGRETGRATSAAEAGVLTSLLPGLVAAVLDFLLPATGSDLAVPLINRVVGSIAINVALGGISAWFGGWSASRSRTPVR